MDRGTDCVKMYGRSRRQHLHGLYTMNQAGSAREPKLFQQFNLWSKDKLNVLNRIIIAGAWIERLPEKNHIYEANQLVTSILHIAGVEGNVNGEHFIQIYNYLVDNPKNPRNPLCRWEDICVNYLNGTLDPRKYTDEWFNIRNHHGFLAEIRAQSYSILCQTDVSDVQACHKYQVEEYGVKAFAGTQGHALHQNTCVIPHEAINIPPTPHGSSRRGDIPRSDIPPRYRPGSERGPSPRSPETRRPSRGRHTSSDSDDLGHRGYNYRRAVPRSPSPHYRSTRRSPERKPTRYQHRSDYDSDKKSFWKRKPRNPSPKSRPYSRPSSPVYRSGGRSRPSSPSSAPYSRSSNPGTPRYSRSPSPAHRSDDRPRSKRQDGPTTTFKVYTAKDGVKTAQIWPPREQDFNRTSTNRSRPSSGSHPRSEYSSRRKKSDVDDLRARLNRSHINDEKTPRHDFGSRHKRRFSPPRSPSTSSDTSSDTSSEFSDRDIPPPPGLYRKGGHAYSGTEKGPRPRNSSTRESTTPRYVEIRPRGAISPPPSSRESRRHRDKTPPRHRGKDQGKERGREKVRVMERPKSGKKRR